MIVSLHEKDAYNTINIAESIKVNPQVSDVHITHLNIPKKIIKKLY